jgi:hypothetical protein
MSNEEQNIPTIKKSKSFHKTHKLPDLQIKIGNNKMKFSEYNSKDKYEMNHKILSTNYHQTLLLKNEEMNNKNNGKIINEKKFNSEDCYISTDVENSPKRIKKSNLKVNSNIPNQNIEQKKSVKFAGNNNDKPLETIIIIHHENNDEEEKNNSLNKMNKKNDNHDCKCDCSIF